MGENPGRVVESRPDWVTDDGVREAPRLTVSAPAEPDALPETVLSFAAAHADAPLMIVELDEDPDSLRPTLLSSGFASYVEPRDDGGHRLFLRADAACAPELVDWSAEDVDVPMRLIDGVAHLDLAGLEPPQPMIAILRLIDGGEWPGEIAVSLSREPIWLFPELQDRGWTWRQVPGAAGKVSLILSPPDAANPSEPAWSFPARS